MLKFLIILYSKATKFSTIVAKKSLKKWPYIPLTVFDIYLEKIVVIKKKV